MVGYNNKRQWIIEIGFQRNESQTMMTFVSKAQSQSLIILGWYLPHKRVIQKVIFTPPPHYLEIFKTGIFPGGDCFSLGHLLGDESWSIALTWKTLKMTFWYTSTVCSYSMQQWASEFYRWWSTSFLRAEVNRWLCLQTYWVSLPPSRILQIHICRINYCLVL